MNHIQLNDRLESFSALQELPDCDHLSQGRKLLNQIKNRSSLQSRMQLSYILNGLSLPAGGNVLEVGPGCGNYALEFCIRGFNFCGFDMVDQNISVWRTLKSQYGLEGDVRVQDICTVDTDEYESLFDGIFSISTFEHIHDQSQALQNCYKMLKPGGRIFVIDGNMLDPRLIFQMLFKRRDGGFRWLFNKNKVYDDYGIGWKGKCEDVKSVFWWKSFLLRNGFSIAYLSTTTTYHSWVRRLGLWPFLGGVIAVGEK